MELAQHTVWGLVLIVVGWVGLFLLSVRDRDEPDTQRKRRMPKLLYAVALASWGLSPSMAQQPPPGMDWRQIQTERFNVIFPAAIAADAQRVANTLEHIYSPVSKTLKGPQKSVDVVLVNQLAQPNGFVALAPRRSVWFSTPPQDAGLLTGEWYQLLAVHEMRHVVQFDRLRRGLVRVAWALAGQQGESAAGALLVPAWFWEGDATGVETALSETGRGRMPRFSLDVRAILLAGRHYSYYKALHRSYKDWYPDHYRLGYFMTTYVKRRYGPEIWDQVLGRTARWGFHPFAFSRALRKYTGASAAQTYEQTMDEMTGLWQTQQEGLPTTPRQVLSGQEGSGVWTNYEFPHPLADGSVLASISGLSDPPTLVRLHPDGRQERLRLYQSLGGLRAGGGKVTWNRSTPDRRWGFRNYSDVMVLDIDSGRLRQLTHKAKLFAPAPSPDGTRIAAVEFGPDRRCHLVVLATATGAEQARFAAPEGVFWRTPAWSEDGRYIAVVRQEAHGNALERLDAATGQGQIALPHTHTDIGWPVFWGSYLLFDSPYGGIDNIHAVHLQSGARYRVTSRPLAASHAAVAGEQLLFQEYTVDGWRIGAMPLDPATWMPIEKLADRRVRYWEPLIDQEQGGTVLADIPQRTYPVSSYRPLGHLLKVHSWSYLPLPPSYALSLTSSDLLNLSSASGGVEYNSNERAFSALGDVSLAAWYPIFSVGGRWGERAGDYKIKTRQMEGDSLKVKEEEVTDQWTEKSLRAAVELPFDLSRGSWASSALLSVQAEWADLAGRDRLHRPGDDLYWPDSTSVGQAVQEVLTQNHNGRFAPLTYQLTFERSRQQARRDLAPAWGQRLQLTYRHTPFGGDFDGRLLSGRLGLFLPGLAAHHSLRLEGGYEWQEEDAAEAQPYRFASQQPFVRGYDYRFHHRFYQGAANYALPLLYPDWSLGALLFVQRIKVNIFYDYGRGVDAQSPTIYQTAGAEMMANFHPFSLPIPLDMGLRYTYRFDEGAWRLGAVVNMEGF